MTIDFDDLEDAGRTHSRFAPSSLKRIIACPRSVALSEAMAGTEHSGSSVYAAEGTVAHTVAEAHLLTWQDGALPHNLIPVELAVNTAVDQEGYKITIDTDMHRYGAAYADYVRGMMVPGDELHVEVTVRLDAIVGAAANMYGHCDAAIWSPSRRTLIAVDYKYGRGIKVSAIENEQLMAYALGALLSIPGLNPADVAYIETHVFQPRVPGQTPFDTFATVDLLRWGHEVLAPIVARIEKDGAADAPLVTGKHCTFCPILHSCPAQRKRASDAVKKAFAASPLITGLSEAELAEALGEARMTQEWAASVEAESLRRAMAGKHIPDNKLVATRGKRVWLDANAAADALLADYDSVLLFDEPKLKSVAQIEKLLTEKPEGFDDLYETKSSGLTLVSLNDPRAPVRTTGAKEAFRNSPLPTTEQN